jgi:anti-anti-sigma factor
MEFAWRIRPDFPVPTVEVTGELDVDSGPYLQEQLRSITRAYGADLALDLSGVTFIDCSGVNALLASGRDARRLGGRTRVTCASPCVRRIAGILGLERVLGIMPSGQADGRGRRARIPGCSLSPAPRSLQSRNPAREETGPDRHVVAPMRRTAGPGNGSRGGSWPGNCRSGL